MWTEYFLLIYPEKCKKVKKQSKPGDQLSNHDRVEYPTNQIWHILE